MELVLEPEMYVLSVNADGKYVDHTPPPNVLKKGIRCPCHGGKIVFNMTANFKAHTKSDVHQNWVEKQNINKSNFYEENVKLKEEIRILRITNQILEKEKQEFKSIFKNQNQKLVEILSNIVQTNKKIQDNSILLNPFELD